MAERKYLSLDKLELYHGKEVARVDGLIAAAKTEVKGYAESLGENYDAAGSAATVQGNLDTEAARAKAEEERIAGLVSTAQGEVDALEGVVAGKAAQADLEALEGYVGEFTHDTAKTVVEYINAKTDGIATSGNLEALGTRVTAVEGDVATIKGDYLKASDKTELEGKISAKADQSALDAVSSVANAAVKQSDYDTKVQALEGEDARIVGLVEAEAARAAGAESGLETRLVKVETFFETAEGETISEAMDTLVEIQKYITEDGAAADEMVKDIAANAKSIADHIATNHDFAGADAALKAELEGKIGTKAESSVVTELSGKVTANEGAIAALQGEDTSIKGRLDTLEGKFGDGEGSVEDMIAAAKAEAISTAAGDATTKANTAESNAKGHADSLNTAMNARVEALEAIDHEHSNKAELDLIVSGDKAKWDAASAKAHEHSNLSVLEGITAAKVTAWDAAEGNAKTFAQGLNDTLAGRVTANEQAIANFVEISESEINALFA